MDEDPVAHEADSPTSLTSELLGNALAWACRGLLCQEYKRNRAGQERDVGTKLATRAVGPGSSAA